MGRIVKRGGKSCLFIKRFFSLFSSFSLSFCRCFLDRLLCWSAGRETWLNLLSVQPIGVHYIISKSRGARGHHSKKRAIKDPRVSPVPLRSKICGGKVIRSIVHQCGGRIQGDRGLSNGIGWSFNPSSSALQRPVRTRHQSTAKVRARAMMSFLRLGLPFFWSSMAASHFLTAR
jgi:hypothetical protein